MAADYFILLAEHDSRTGGKHFETGFAYAAKKNILIVGRRENVFHWLHGIMFDETWEKAIKRIHRTLEAVTDFVSQ